MKAKKGISLLLLLALLLGMLGQAVAQDNFNETGLPIVNEPITITVAVIRHENDATASFAEKFAMVRAAEETNIQIEWIEIMSTNMERVPVMLAGDLPDVFLGLLTDSQISQNTELFVPLNDLMETYCPNVMDLYRTSVPDWENFLTYPDGNIYGLMGSFLSSYNDSINGVMFMNQVWLDNVGMEAPTTMDALYDVLVAFRDLDADGDGDAGNEIPLDFCQAHYASKYWQLARSWGFPDYYDIQDGQIVGTVNTDAFREFLSYFNMLCNEGLINKEGLTQTAEQYNSNLGSMKVGAFWGWAPYTYINGAENQQQYTAVAPVLVDGYTPRVFSNNNIAKRNNLVITTACDDVEAVLRWWDYLSQSQEAAYEGRSGPVGLNFYQGDDGVFYSRTPTEAEGIEAGYAAYANNIGTSTWAATMGLTLCAPLMLSSLAVDVEANPTATAAIRRVAVDKVAPYFTEEVMVKSIVPPENQEEFDFATDGLLDYIDSFVASSILNGVTDDTWNAYLSQLSVYGYDFYLSWYQDYYDGNFLN